MSKSMERPFAKSIAAASQFPRNRCATPRVLNALALSGFIAMAASQSRIAAVFFFCLTNVSARLAYTNGDGAFKRILVNSSTALAKFPELNS